MKKHTTMPSSRDLRTCPLCGRMLPHRRLHEHIHTERWQTRHEIMLEIRKEQPNWAEQDGACKRCWESYRGVVRVVKFMDHFKFPKHWRRQVEVSEKIRA